MKNLIYKIAKTSRSAFLETSFSKIDQRNSAILSTSKLLKDNIPQLLDANKIDLEKAKEKNISASFLDRLTLNEKRIIDMCNGLIDISKLDDPIGRELDNGPDQTDYVFQKFQYHSVLLELFTNQDQM